MSLQDSSFYKKEIIRVHEWKKKRQDTWIVDKVSLSVYEGEILGIFGSPSEGRAALGQLLCGQIQADGGVMYVDSVPRNFHNIWELQQNGIHYICPRLKMIPYMNLAENLCVIRPAEQIPRSERYLVKRRNIHLLCREYLEEWGIQAESHAYPEELSREKQYLCLMLKAIMCDARVIILDGIGFHMLCAMEEGRIFLEKIHKSKISLVILDFSIDSMENWCDRMYVFQHGRVKGSLFHDEFSRTLLLEMLV